MILAATNSISLQYVGWVPVQIIVFSFLGSLVSVAILVKKRYTAAAGTPSPPVWVDALTSIVAGVCLAAVFAKAFQHKLNLEETYMSAVAGGIGLLGVPLALAIIALGEKLIAVWATKFTPADPAKAKE